MKFIYTEAALQELQAFQNRQQKLLEELIAERKFVYGDDKVEVTASDIKEASEFIRAYRPRATRYSSLRLVSQIYVFLGAMITLIALFFPALREIFRENIGQAVALMIGVMIMIVGVLGSYIYRLRARQVEEMKRSWYEEQNSSFHIERDRS